MEHPAPSLPTNKATSSVSCQTNLTSRLPHRYLQVLRVLGKNLEKKDLANASSGTIRAWSQWYTLHTGLLTWLIRRSYQFFRIGSSIVNQINVPVGNLPLRFIPLSAQRYPTRLRDESKLSALPGGHLKTLPHWLENILEPTVPDWTPSQVSNKWTPDNTTALPKLSDTRVSISHRFLLTTGITKGRYAREVSGYHRSSHQKKWSSEPSNTVKSTKFQTRASKVFNQERSTPIVRFLYDRQVTPVVPTVTLKFPLRSWKLSLPQLNYIEALSTDREKVVYSPETHPFFDLHGPG